MNVIDTKHELRGWRRGLDVGTPVVLVPTMGALHVGHCALISAARQRAGEHGRVVVTIFVNPTQFNQASDLENYPSTLEADLALCEQYGADAVFCPSASEVYADDSSVMVSERSLSATLCGATRPGHFDGVCTVVLKLYNLVQPDAMLFGEKDFQQVAVVQRMVRDLDLSVEIQPVPTVRAESGLALSSRNARLTAVAQQEAPQLYAALCAAREVLASGALSAGDVEAFVQGRLGGVVTELRWDYISLVHPETMQAATARATAGEGGEAILAVAVFFGEIRLIDHVRVTLL